MPAGITKIQNANRLAGADSGPYRRAFDLCVSKSRMNIKDLAGELVTGTWSWALDGDYSQFKERFFEIGNWTSSFFTGMALLAWQKTEDEFFVQQVLRLAPVYRKKACVNFLNLHHDAGFLYSLYSVALYKLTQDTSHREVGLAAAEALYQRFNPKGNFIRAWGRLDGAGEQVVDGRATDNMAIIDCMMNLPLLYWASLETGNRKYYEAAVRQAETTRKCFVRPDYSVCHAFRFDLEKGVPLGPDNICGYNVESHWARGTAWAIYGFALSYRYTGHKQYLDTCLAISRKFIELLDGEVVPVWDFRLPSGAPQIPDASAAAIAVCGFQELEKLGSSDALISKTKRVLLKRICSGDYLDANPDCRGILKNAYGNQPAYSSWGDYFLMEALSRELQICEGWW